MKEPQPPRPRKGHARKDRFRGVVLRLVAFCFLFVPVLACAYDAPNEISLEPDHCVGVIWSRQGVFDLSSMLDSSCAPFMDLLYFEVNGERCANNAIHYSFCCPGPLKPDIYYVVLRHVQIERPLDAMWVVVNSPTAKAQFDAWYEANTNTAWTATLPTPYLSIVVTNGIAIDPEPPEIDGKPGIWDAPHRINSSSHLHHNAVWEMRTTIGGASGNQATYDSDGNLIRSTIAAGTADRCGPYGPDGFPRKNWNHVNEDVHPFIQALQLDGNPVRIAGLSVWFPLSLSRPCLHQGDYTEKYLQCRPTILP